MSYANNDELGRTGQDLAKRIIDNMRSAEQGRALAAEFKVLALVRALEDLVSAARPCAEGNHREESERSGHWIPLRAAILRAVAVMS